MKNATLLKVNFYFSLTGYWLLVAPDFSNAFFEKSG